METDNIKNEIRRFIKQHFKIPDSDADFNDEVHLFDYGYVDSFGAVALTTFVEEAFAIKIKQTDMIAYPMNTISEIAAFTAKRQKGEI